MGERAHLLVAHGSDVTRDLLSHLLNTEGYAVAATGDGGEALDMMRRQRVTRYEPSVITNPNLRATMKKLNEFEELGFGFAEYMILERFRFLCKPSLICFFCAYLAIHRGTRPGRDLFNINTELLPRL